jgi:hypothetical protein
MFVSRGERKRERRGGRGEGCGVEMEDDGLAYCSFIFIICYQNVNRGGNKKCGAFYLRLA